jgi:hypothetical protein
MTPPTTGLDPSGELERLVGELEERLDAIVDKMLSAYAQNVPSYRATSPDVTEDIREGARASILVGAGILRGEVSAEDVREPLRELGRRRAHQDLPLHDVINAFMVGTRTFWEEIVASAPTAPQERADVLSRVMVATLDLLQNATASVSAGYQEVDAIRIADEEHDHRTIVEMMAGIRKMDDHHEDRAARRGIAMESLRWCLVTTVEESSGRVVHELRRRHPGAPVARSGRFLIAFLPGAEAPPGVEDHECGLASAPDHATAYRRARSAHKVALHLRRAAVIYDEVVPLALVLDAPPEERVAFIDAQLGRVLADPLGEDLVASLKTFYAAGQSVAAAARELHVHRHTLEYRLGRLEALLGQDIRANEPRLLLELALSLRAAEGNPG